MSDFDKGVEFCFIEALEGLPHYLVRGFLALLGFLLQVARIISFEIPEDSPLLVLFNLNSLLTFFWLRLLYVFKVFLD